MKIKIVQAGYEGLNGQLGVFDFVDGLSVQDIPYLDALHLSAIMAVVDDATGDHPSKSPFEVTGSNLAVAVEHREGALVTAEEVMAPVASNAVHTRESLEAIADATGIKGVREIADPMGLKDNSIVELITKILAVQAAMEAAAVKAAEEAEVLAAAAAKDPVDFAAVK